MKQDNRQVDAASGGRDAQPGALSVGRRRFAKGVAPALLGTLASKPVLGAQYICTVSGHTSGNASAHIIQGVDCSVGKSPAEREAEATWPGTFVKGGLPDPTSCGFGTGLEAQGTLFNGTQGLASKFFYSTASVNGCAVGTTSGSEYAPASMRQVLVTTGSDEVLRLGRAVVASLLNAVDPSIPSYPVSAATIVQMFNAVVDGGSYHVPSVNLSLTRAGVIQYLEKLYSPSP